MKIFNVLMKSQTLIKDTKLNQILPLNHFAIRLILFKVLRLDVANFLFPQQHQDAIDGCI